MKLSVLLVSGALAVGVVEIALRVCAPTSSPKTYHVWPPNLHKTFRPPPELVRISTGVSRVTINAMGIRGDLFSDRDRYRILTIGGSTTECTFLDDTKVWPHLLQELMNARLEPSRVWVGNVGKGGHHTRHHMLQASYLLGQYPSIDAVVLLVGINDLHLRIPYDDDYRPLSARPSSYRDELMGEAFSIVPTNESSYPIYKRTEIWRRARAVKSRLLMWIMRNRVIDEYGTVIIRWREHRRNASAIRHTLPDLNVALQEYTQNINAIIDAAESHGVRVVCATQPVLWHDGMPREWHDLLWMGGVGNFQGEMGKEYYSVEALALGMQRYNQTLAAVCRTRGVECVDLASMIPYDRALFQDDCHYTEEGARRVAQILADYLLGGDPFNVSGHSGQESLTK